MNRTLESQSEFIDNGNAREFFATGLHDVEVMGPVTRIIMYVMRRTPEGVPYRDACVSCVIPTEAIGAAIALLLTKTGQTVDLPIAGDPLLIN